MALDAKPASEPSETLETAPPEKPPEENPPSAAASAFIAKAKDLEALRSAVIDAANVGAGLWLSYLFVLFYLAIAVGSVSHHILLFESPIKLPFLNVDLPVMGFYVLGPALFLVVHTYVLLHFAMLADKVGVFHAELKAQVPDDDARARLRRQLPSNIFVQFLAGPREVRTGAMGFLLRLIAQISLVAGPLALLVLFHLQFLAYHNEAAAWWQRIAVVCDLLILWTLWPSIARGETTRIGWRDFRRGKVSAAMVASLVPVLLVVFVATFPGEWLDSMLPAVRFVPVYEATRLNSGWTFVSLHDLLVGGEVDLVSRKPTSLWSSRLVLPGLELTDPSGEKIAAGNFSLRGRHLEGAVLIDAHLKGVDFTASHLQGAHLDRADIRDATFLCASRNLKEEDTSKPSDARLDLAPRDCAQLQNATFDSAKLQGALLNGAQLQGATLTGAQLQGARLEQADLGVGAKLNGANLQGAVLISAHLKGAVFTGADLRGSEVTSAELQGASFRSALLQGATLEGAKLIAADFRAARLQAASFADADLQGATFYGAHLPGATIRNARLQGTDFKSADMPGALFSNVQLQGAAQLGTSDLRGATFDRVFVWRTDVSNALDSARVLKPETGPKQQSEDCRRGQHVGTNELPPCDWTSEAFAKLKQLIVDQVPEETRRDEALKQIAVLDPATPLDREEIMAKAWSEHIQAAAATTSYEEKLASALREIGCAEGAFVLHRFASDLWDRFDVDSPRPGQLAAIFLDEKKCPGAKGLSEDDRIKFQAIRDRVLTR